MDWGGSGQVKIPFCESHKNAQCRQFEDIEQIDFDEVSPVIIRPHSFIFDECKHKQILVDDVARTAECEKCGKMLDAIGCLMEIAKGIRTIDYKLKAMAEFDRKQKEKAQRQRDREIARAANQIGIKIVNKATGDDSKQKSFL